MEVDTLHSDSCLKRKLESGSQEWPCKVINSELEKYSPCSVDETRKPLRFFYMNKGRWMAFGDKIDNIIWLSFTSNKKSARFSVSQQLYVVHFPHMMQLNLQTGYVHSVAWLHISGKFFRPAKCFEGRSHLWLSLLQKKSWHVEARRPKIHRVASPRIMSADILCNSPSASATDTQCLHTMRACHDVVRESQQ
ncbi:hypothetical protein KP509_33G049100 [Ceratopteris richardii]|uniref:WWE domain-containing protein n=1 Tax=Ceratopteris richardii TaxID=49495 RepID=A0A8T2QR70_CERRI|nr:hypothetical protein KP509_33G049100 [Ceratopteris richardii]